jgi:hypothetical protein
VARDASRQRADLRGRRKYERVQVDERRNPSVAERNGGT